MTTPGPAERPPHTTRRTTVVSGAGSRPQSTPRPRPVLMLDGRQHARKAGDRGHPGPRGGDRQRGSGQLDLIAGLSEDQSRSSGRRRCSLFARGGAAPAFPKGNTDSEKRGRRLFVDAPSDPSDGSTPACARTATGAPCSTRPTKPTNHRLAHIRPAPGSSAPASRNSTTRRTPYAISSSTRRGMAQCRSPARTPDAH